MKTTLDITNELNEIITYGDKITPETVNYVKTLVLAELFYDNIHGNEEEREFAFKVNKYSSKMDLMYVKDYSYEKWREENRKSKAV